MILTGKETHLLFHGDFCVCLYACKDDSNQICILILYIYYTSWYILYIYYTSSYSLSIIQSKKQINIPIYIECISTYEFGLPVYLFVCIQ